MLSKQKLSGATHSKDEERRFNVEFQGYCVKCREKRTIKDGTVGETAKGRPMVKGSCPVCGTTVTRFLSDKESSK
jgi:hypothetical protein